MRDTERLFSETPVLRLFFTASVPGALGMLMQSAYSLLDGIFVGHFVSETAFAAINLAMPYVIVCFAFGDLIGFGSAVPISISLGKGEHEQANNTFTCACLMNVAFGLVTGLAFLLFAPAIMGLMGATGELQETAALYLRVYAVFLPITSTCFAADNYLRICGKIRRSLWCNILLAVTGAALEFYLLGVADLGVGAAAFSYCVAMVVSVVVSMAPFFSGKLDLTFCRPRFSKAIVVEIMRDGLPVFLENVAGRITSIVLNVALLALGGEEAVSIFGVAIVTETVIVPILYGTLDALQPAIGFNWGAGNRQRVRSLERCCFAAAFVISLVYVAVCCAVPKQIVLIFMPEADPEFLRVGTFAVLAFTVSYLIRWFSLATQSYMVAIGESRLAAIISLAQSFVFPLAALALLWPLGLTGLWFNMAASSLATSVLAAFVLRHFRRGPSRPAGAD